MTALLHYGFNVRLAAWIMCCAVIGPMVCASFAQSADNLTADQVKAGFIYNFSKYVDWPSSVDPDPYRFHICIAGNDGVAEQLQSAVHGKTTGGRPIGVRRVGEDLNVTGCEILYVGNISKALADRLSSGLAGQPVLTVGSSPAFLRGEGILTFVVEDNRVRFDINLRIAAKVNLHFDSRILALARRTTEVKP